MQEFTPLDGAILIDKPAGPTSHDVVDVIRRKFGIRKVGHCGTLDPNATGLLIVVLGRGTKLSGSRLSLGSLLSLLLHWSDNLAILRQPTGLYRGLKLGRKCKFGLTESVLTLLDLRGQGLTLGNRKSANFAHVDG